MTINYPISCPITVAPAAVRWGTSTVVSITTSPTSFQQTKYEFDGEIWTLAVSYEPLTREEAAPFFAFLAALRGQNGTFTFGDTLLNLPLGASGGTPRINGGSQAGTKELVTDGWTASTLVLKAGDFFSVDNRLYMVLADVTSNGTGQATIDIFPRARTHDDNALITTNNPRGTFRLTNSDVAIVEANATQLFDISFIAQEAL